jgi:hypothetical protein
MRRRAIVFAAVLALLCACLNPLAAPAATAASAVAPTVATDAPKEAAPPEPREPSVLPQQVDGEPKNTKADWQVAAVVGSVLSSGPAAALGEARANNLTVSGNGVRVIVESTNLAQAQSSVTASGAVLEASAGDLIQVLATPTELAALLNAPGIRYVRSPMPHAADAVAGEGVVSTNANSLQALGNTGAGVKVAVIDLGFSGLAAAQANGDIPISVTTVDYCSGGFGTVTQHGTAVAEIVHEMAPGATLYLICVGTEVQLAQAETYAKGHGIQIVNHSVGWWNSSRGDGSGAAGTPDATVADANANGILWVNAAGNQAQQHWSGSFVDNGSGWNLFSAGDPGNQFSLAAGATRCAYLKWDSWPATSQDYDLYVVRLSDGAYVSSATSQTGTQAPVEGICFTNAAAISQTFFVAIYRYQATFAPRFDLYVPNANLQYQVAAGSVTEPASSPSAFAAGAVCWQGTTIEPFSSQGPTIDGRIKPDLSGPDAVSSFTYGSFSGCDAASGFFGTSAASPHVAGAAALVKSANPTFTVAQMKTYLQTYSRDLGAAGKDNVYGSGLLFLPTAPAKPTSLAAVAGNATVDLTWTAPASDGGSAINGYVVTETEAGHGVLSCAMTGATSCTVSGLTNSTEYTFTVHAANSVGPGPESDPSNKVTPVAPTAPGKPTNLLAAAGHGTVGLAWTAPASDGHSAITGYVVTETEAGLGVVTCSMSGATSCTVSGLTNGTEYTFTIHAANSVGPGPESDPSNKVTPVAPTAPGKPTGVTATGGLGSASISWIAPADDGGSAITGYTVTSAPDGRTCATIGAASCTVSGLTSGTTYTFTVAATNVAGTGLASDPSAGLLIFTGATFHAITPGRVLDSRTGLGAGLFRSRTKQSFQVTGLYGVPAGAVAVTGNVTVVGQTALGYVTVAPSLTTGTQPGTSTINFPDGDIRANGITVPLGAGGKLDAMYWAGSTSDTVNVLFDVTGYFANDTTGATFHAVTPGRVLDSRTGLGAASFTSRTKQAFQVTGLFGVPAGAVAVTGNVTIVGQSGLGYVTVAPLLTTGTQPGTSTINFPNGDIRANGITVPLGDLGKLDAMYWTGSTSDTVNVLFDVTGYFANDTIGATFHAVTPGRVLDSRTGLGAATFTSRTKQGFQVSGLFGVPDGAVAVTGNVTVVGQTALGYVTAAPSLTSGVQPGTSTINFPNGDIRANGISVPLGGGGKLDAMYWAGSTSDTVNVLFDVTGYFS